MNHPNCQQCLDGVTHVHGVASYFMERSTDQARIDAWAAAIREGDLRRRLYEAEDRIAHLEALLGEAPHSPGCRMFHAMYGGSEADARAAGSLCNCFKVRVDECQTDAAL